MSFELIFFQQGISKPFPRGWIFGDEDGGCDRALILSEDRNGAGVMPSCAGGFSGSGSLPKFRQWNHVVVTYNQGVAETAYLNGVQVADGRGE